MLNAYAITFGALLVAMGRPGERLVERLVFLAGITVFTVASLAVARVVQAVGAAAPYARRWHCCRLFGGTGPPRAAGRHRQ